MCRCRYIDALSGVELECGFRAVDIEVNLAFRMEKTHDAIQLRVSGVECTCRICSIQYKAVVDEGIFGPEQERLIRFNARKVFDGTRRNQLIVNHKIFRRVQCSFRPRYAVLPADVEVAITLDCRQGISEFLTCDLSH